MVPRLPELFSKPIHINLPISHAGVFKYWIEYQDDSYKVIKGREGYFNVDPVLRVKSRTPILSGENKLNPPLEGGIVQTEETNIPLDALAVLTTVSKWMGPLSDWERHFREASERGYNMVHYTPLQQAGSSESPYSIADQIRFDQKVVGNVSREIGLSKVQDALRLAREEYGLLSLIDIVLNHTANNTPWLLEHPEAGNLSQLAALH